MDFGYLIGNRITIPNPGNRTLNTEEDLLFYLRTNPKARDEIFKLVKEKQMECPIEGIWVEHDELSFPILVLPSTTPQLFCSYLEARLKFQLRKISASL